jgi:hypothetical protein
MLMLGLYNRFSRKKAAVLERKRLLIEAGFGVQHLRQALEEI